MYYGEHDDPYQNDKLNYHFKKNLPMEEFSRGNFSQAGKIIDVYETYLQTCLSEAKKRYIGDTPDVKTYLKKELEQLQQQHKERTEKLNKAIKRMEEIEKETVKEIEALKAEDKGNHARDVFIKFLENEKINRNFTEFMLARDILAIDNPEKHRDAQETYHNFLNSLHTQKIQELQFEFSKTKSEKNEARRQLSHGSNSTNIEKGIKEIETGVESSYLSKRIQEDLEKILRKRSPIRDELLDEREIKDFFTSIVTTQLITNPGVQPKLKRELIKSHTDKLGLFDHIWNLHTEHRHDVHKLIKDPEEKEMGVREQMIQSLLWNAKNTIEKMPDISSFFRLDDKSSEEEFEQRQNMGMDEWRTQIIEKMIKQMDVLFKGEKKCNRKAVHDPLLTKLFEGIYIIHESYDFEDLCGRVWDTDFFNNREILRADGRDILKTTINYMSPEEREIVKDHRGGRATFDNIEDEIIQQERQGPKQLLLYNFSPIFELKGYVESVSENIKTLIGEMSLKQKRLCEDVVCEILRNKGFGTHIDSSAEMPELSDEKFLEILENANRGKTLSLKIKKTKGKIFPDINNWINSMKEVK